MFTKKEKYKQLVEKILNESEISFFRGNKNTVFWRDDEGNGGLASNNAPVGETLSLRQGARFIKDYSGFRKSRDEKHPVQGTLPFELEESLKGKDITFMRGKTEKQLKMPGYWYDSDGNTGDATFDAPFGKTLPFEKAKKFIRNSKSSSKIEEISDPEFDDDFNNPDVMDIESNYEYNLDGDYMEDDDFLEEFINPFKKNKKETSNSDFGEVEPEYSEFLSSARQIIRSNSMYAEVEIAREAIRNASKFYKTVEKNKQMPVFKRILLNSFLKIKEHNLTNDSEFINSIIKVAKEELKNNNPDMAEYVFGS